VVRRHLGRQVVKIIIDAQVEHAQGHAVLRARLLAPARPAQNARTITAVTARG
jgi:hypothetical protein